MSHSMLCRGGGVRRRAGGEEQHVPLYALQGGGGDGRGGVRSNQVR